MEKKLKFYKAHTKMLFLLPILDTFLFKIKLFFFIKVDYIYARVQPIYIASISHI